MAGPVTLDVELRRLFKRLVNAIESIAANTKPVNRVTAPVIDPPASGEVDRLPAFFIPKDAPIIHFDEAAANGVAEIDENGITIKLSPQYYPDFVREVIGRHDIKPVAVTVGISYRETFTTP